MNAPTPRGGRALIPCSAGHEAVLSFGPADVVGARPTDPDERVSRARALVPA